MGRLVSIGESLLHDIERYDAKRKEAQGQVAHESDAASRGMAKTLVRVLEWKFGAIPNQMTETIGTFDFARLFSLTHLVRKATALSEVELAFAQLDGQHQ
jgi:hypothetical protein